MGVINVTPDSFSGDGLGGNIDAAVQQALRFQSEGADIIDIGGESTRPASIYSGAGPVSTDEEIERVIPVIEALASVLEIPVSVDTYKAAVATEALAAGASMINDVWGFRRDPDMAGVAANAGVPVVLMHNQHHTRYSDLVPDVIWVLRQMADAAVAAGVRRENIILDPGMGFGKTAEHNLEMLRRLGEFQSLGAPLLVECPANPQSAMCLTCLSRNGWRARLRRLRCRLLLALTSCACMMSERWRASRG